MSDGLDHAEYALAELITRRALVGMSRDALASTVKGIDE